LAFFLKTTGSSFGSGQCEVIFSNPEMVGRGENWFQNSEPCCCCWNHMNRLGRSARLFSVEYVSRFYREIVTNQYGSYPKHDPTRNPWADLMQQTTTTSARHKLACFIHTKQNGNVRIVTEPQRFGREMVSSMAAQGSGSND
jgi:hypothetical protein